MTPRGELANRGFRYGFCFGIVVGLATLVPHSVLMVLASWAEANSGQHTGNVGFLVYMWSIFSIPVYAAYCIVGTILLGLICAACGVVMGNLVHRERQ